MGQKDRYDVRDNVCHIIAVLSKKYKTSNAISFFINKYILTYFWSGSFAIAQVLHMFHLFKTNRYIFSNS